MHLSRIPLHLIGFALVWVCASAANAQAPAGATRIRDELVQPPNASELRQGRMEHPFQVVAGQLVEVRVDADGFDSVLQLVLPSGDTLYNDDYLSTRTSRISTIAAAGGEWRAVVSALDLLEGTYELAISLGTPGRIRELRGNLTESSQMSAKGHRYERHTYNLAGQAQLVVQATATGFDPEIVLHSPSGEIINDPGQYSTPGVVSVTVPNAESGDWEIIATHSSYADSQLGSYTIQIVEAEPVAEPDGEVTRGQLTEANPLQIHGERYAEHRVNGTADAGMSIKLSSSDFDAFLAVRSPSGEWYRDDDSGGEGAAMLVLPPGQGEWLAVVTSYAPGETGSYEMTVYR